MNNLHKLNKAFIASFGVDEAQLLDLSKCNTNKWDSVGHMTLITYLEDEFEIIIGPEDIMDFTSYQEAKTILNDKYNIEF
ncbi:MAG: acyl carrier protein [Paludibacteraceae bacterium]|nr:acyl carrier protein [Paludibacteraceae bacterium]